MERRLLFSLYFLICYLGKAQHIEWAKNTSSDHPTQLRSKGLLVDSQGNIYNYGSQDWGTITNGVESYFSKYSPSGQMNYTKVWPFRFSKIIYDGDLFFYAAGSFSGQAMPNNLLMKSRGGTDGFIAKMDLNGNFIWVKSIGAHGDDVCKSLTFNAGKTNLIVAGGLTDSLYVNSTYVNSDPQRSMLLARFDLQGNIINNALINFDTDIDQSSCGYEIENDHMGNFIVLAFKEGAHWSNYSTAPGTEGFYLCKYNSSFSELWSNFIINGSCYYGFSCGGLSVDDLGNSFIPSYCSGKYGGQGILRKFDNGGVLTWSLNISDAGGHKATCVNGNLFLVGTDGANGCPCPDSHQGYAVIRKLDQNYVQQGELKMKNVGLMNHAVYSNGYLFIDGNFNSSGAYIGNDTLTNLDTYYGSFIARLKDVNCAPPATDSAFAFWKPFVHCPQQPVLLDAGAGHLEYKWSNGATTQTIFATADGSYRVKIKQASGCEAYSLPIAIQKKETFPKELLYTTYDNTSGFNKIHWHGDSWWQGDPANFKLFKTTASDTILLGVFSPTYQNGFIDSSSVNDNARVTYFMTNIDSCGTESERGRIHAPVYLTSIDNSLRWTKFEGYNFDKYYILRAKEPHNLQHFASTDEWHTEKYEDIDTNYYYQIMVKRPGWGEEGKSFSNIVKGKGQFLTSPPLVPAPLYVDIFPNPSQGIFNLGITLPKEKAVVNMRVLNVMGKEVKRSDIVVSDKYANATLDLTEELRGIYFVVLETEDNVKIQKRIVVQQ